MEKRFETLLSSATNYLEKIECDTKKNTPPFKCAVTKCKNKFVNYKDHQQSLFKFHNFPENIREALIWKKLCGLNLHANVSNLKVCSDHFSLDDYERNFKEEFLNPAYKRTLKDCAYPLIGVKSADSLEDIILEVTEEIEKYSDQIYNYDIEVEEEKEEANISQSKEPDNNQDIRSQIKSLEKEVGNLKTIIKSRRKRIAFKTEVISELKKQLLGIRNEIANSKSSILRSVFSEAQINLLKGDKEKVFWSDDDLAQAFTLRHMGGKDCYLYLKNTLNYPLPSLSCVQTWAAN